MKTEQYIITNGLLQGTLGEQANLVLLFGATKRIKEKGLIDMIRAAYPNACIFGCSTAGEIMGTQVLDNSLIVTAVSFSSTRVRGAMVKVTSIEDSYKAGSELAISLAADDLKHVFVLSEGLNINGSELVRGLTKNLPLGTPLTGGLSGDGDRFQETYVLLNNEPTRDAVGAIGFYGSKLQVGYGSFGGWTHSDRSDLLPAPRETFSMNLTVNQPWLCTSNTSESTQRAFPPRVSSSP